MTGEVTHAPGLAIAPVPAGSPAEASSSLPGARSALYLLGTAVVAVAATDADPMLPVGHLLATTGVLSVIALLAKSVQPLAAAAGARGGARPSPFALFAAALIALVLVQLVALDAGNEVVAGSAGLSGASAWMAALAAAVLASGGFALMIGDLTRQRVADAVCLSAIGVTTIGLVSWVGLERAVGAGIVPVGPSMAHVAPVVLDLLVVSLGLHALNLRRSARSVVWLLLLAWTAVLVADASELVAALRDSAPAKEVGAVRLVAFALLGAAALHADATGAAEPERRRSQRLPRSQVVVLAIAVLVGPTTLAAGLDPSVLPGVVAVSVALSVLVVLYLARLVQGRVAFEHRAHHDDLTGLANRTLLEERAELAVAHAVRTQAHTALLFLDLDRFKNVNDSLGHATGNVLLQAVAGRLSAVARPDDTVARLGGDEFVVVLPDLTGRAEAAALADGVLQQFNEPFTVNGHRIFVSPSIGIATFPEDGVDAPELLENADRAMYRAKGQGRRRSCAFERSGDHLAHDRLALESRLHTAVERGELQLQYQPKVQLPGSAMTGMEALLRWQHPELGLLEPNSFITIAEESGLIVPIGEWALDEACRQNQAWVRAGLQPLEVAVNLSLQQFQQQAIEDVVARVLRATGLDPKLLELELTESLAMHDRGSVESALRDLRAMGVTCSIDDFGTGYSGLSHLTQLSVDKLKIDKSFVATIDEEREAPIVVAVVALAHGLGMRVVAEGVETPSQLSRLLELGCDEMQGYLISRPLPPDRFEQLLLQESRRLRADRPLPGVGHLVPGQAER